MAQPFTGQGISGNAKRKGGMGMKKKWAAIAVLAAVLAAVISAAIWKR